MKKSILSDSTLRISDICRTERFYTATLLPVILFHNSFDGLREFIRLLVNDKKASQTLSTGMSSTIKLDIIESKNIEIISEIDIVRDVKYYANWIEGMESIDIKEGKTLRPDMVLIIDDLLIVIEGKFFDNSQSATNQQRIEQQIFSQREVIENILLKYPGYDFKGYCHIFLSAREDIESNQIGCNATITWRDIAKLSANVLGCNHYVTKQFERAIELSDYVEGINQSKDSKKNYKGKKQLNEILEDCKTQGDELLIGFTGGVPKLKQKTASELTQYLFKWDKKENPIGNKIPKNWIPGSTFLKVIRASFPNVINKTC